MQLKVISTLVFVSLAAALAIPSPENLLPPRSNTLRHPPETDALPVPHSGNANNLTPGQVKVMINEGDFLPLPEINVRSESARAPDVYMHHIPGGTKANIAVPPPVKRSKCLDSKCKVSIAVPPPVKRFKCVDSKC